MNGRILSLATTPTEITLLSPQNATANSKELTLIIHGLQPGLTVSVFDSPDCQQALATIKASGENVEMTLTLTNDAVYHFYSQTIDAEGGTSACSAELLRYTLDSQVPSLNGSISVAYSESYDIDKSPTISWMAAKDTGSGVKNYSLAVGTTACATDVKDWQDVGLVTSYQFTGLNLAPGSTYYICHKAVDVSGNESISTASPSWSLYSELWVPNYSVNAIVKSQNKIYIAGNFTKIAPWIGGGVLTDPDTGAVTAAFPRVSGSVSKVISDGNNGFYIAGSFYRIGSTIKNSLAHVLADGSLDPNFTVSVGTVYDMILSGNILYIGGSFDNVNSTTRNNLASVSAITGEVSSFNPNIVGNIYSMALNGANIYIGGSIASVGGTAIDHLAAINVNTGSLDGAFNAHVVNSVKQIIVSGSTLFVCGEFLSFNGVSRPSLAALNISDGSLITGFNANITGGYVASMALSGNKLYISGNLQSIGGQNRGTFASVDSMSGSLNTSFTLTSDQTIQKLYLINSVLYITGNFTTINGTARNQVAAINTIDDTLANYNTNINCGFDSCIRSMAMSGGKLFVGGVFNSADGINVNNLVGIDLLSGRPISTVMPNINGNIYSMTLHNDALYFGGRFTQVNGTARNYMAAISASTGNLLSWDAHIQTHQDEDHADDTNVVSVYPYNNKIYFGGNFTNVAGTTRHYIAAVDATTGVLDNNFNPDADDYISQIAESGSQLYLVGAFTDIGSSGRSLIAAVDPATGSVSTAFTPNISGAEISALTIVGSRIYIGGNFSAVDTVSKNNLAALDLATGALIPSFNLEAQGSVYSLSTSASLLYVGGDIYTLGGVSRLHLAAANTNESTVITSMPTDTNGSVRAMAMSDGLLFVGGNFKSAATGGSLLSAVEVSTGTGYPRR